MPRESRACPSGLFGPACRGVVKNCEGRRKQCRGPKSLIRHGHVRTAACRARCEAALGYRVAELNKRETVRTASRPHGLISCSDGQKSNKCSPGEPLPEDRQLPF